MTAYQILLRTAGGSLTLSTTKLNWSWRMLILLGLQTFSLLVRW